MWDGLLLVALVLVLPSLVLLRRLPVTARRSPTPSIMTTGMGQVRGTLGLWAALAGGCALEVRGPAAVESESHSLEAMTDVAELVAPLDGELLEGGLNAVVPVHGVTPGSGEALHVLAFNHLTQAWVELGSVRSGTRPVARDADTDALLYAYDFGEACLSGCDLTLPLHGWAGFGPFALTLQVVGDATGPVPVYPWDACAGQTEDAAKTCAPLSLPVVTVLAAPIDGH